MRGTSLDILDETSAVSVTAVKPLPKALADLMAADGITEADIRLAVASQGIYPEDVPVADYDDSVINGMIISQWDGLKNYIKQLKGE